jgi:hypothetical protein
VTDPVPGSAPAVAVRRGARRATRGSGALATVGKLARVRVAARGALLRPAIRNAASLARSLALGALAATLVSFFVPATTRAQLAPDSTGCAEPPPEEPEGVDYEIEPADSLAEGAIELGVGASGRGGARPRQTRRVRFNDRALGGSVREGEGDPLAGGSIEAGVLAGRAGVGRLAPRWGRGLLLGAAAEPWSAAANDRGPGAPLRGRAGRGAWYRLGESGAVETLCGRFAKRDLAGGRVQAGPFGFGALADRAGEAQASLSFCRGRSEHELAFDRAGRWRAEAALERRAGSRTFAARVRGGTQELRSLAEPLRSGPARALAMELRDDACWGRVRAQAALWRFAPGRVGARAALELRRRFDPRQSLALGFEERHGTPRESGRIPGFRQGGWSEWRGEVAGMALALRHEVLGAERLGRDAVRTVTAAQVELEGPAGSGLRITHCAYRARSGEGLYLIETSGDRVILRAVSGTGRRTCVELRALGAGGRIHAALEVQGAAGEAGRQAARPRWTLEWTRRAQSR